MNRTHKILSLIVIFSIFLSMLTGYTFESSLPEAQELEEKTFCNAKIDDDFDDSSVLVILDKSYSAINKSHSISEFADVGIESIVDLTELEKYKTKGSSESSISECIEASNKAPTMDIDESNFRQILKLNLKTKSKENVLNVIKQLEKQVGIKYVGPNYYLEIFDEIDQETMNYAQLWQFRNNCLNIDDAWTITTGSSFVKVGIIDSGIGNHEDLVGRVIGGKDFVNNNTTTTDDQISHGTHIAGIIGAVSNNEIGIQGICQNVTLVPLQVTKWDEEEEEDKFVFDSAAIIAAIEYAIDEDIPILNFSGGNHQYDEALSHAISTYPGLFVCAAGNDNQNNDTNPAYPANLSEIFSNVISVGASDKSNAVAGFMGTNGSSTCSNYGINSVSLFAPGFSIYSTVMQGNVSGYDHKSGTSMATPHVTATAALIMSVRPDMTPKEIKDCIMYSVDKNANFTGKCVSGGRLNTYKAVQRAVESRSFIGDVNGDGLSDMIITRPINGNRAIDTYLGQSDGSFAEPSTTSTSQWLFQEDPVFVGDVNGDGKTDLIVHTLLGVNRTLMVYSGRADGSFGGASLVSTSTPHTYGTRNIQFFVTDVNGDGKDDFIVHYKNSSGKRANIVYAGKAVGINGSFNSASTAFTSTNNYVATDPVLIGDFNGDGYSDMVVPYAASGKRWLLVYKGKSTAPYFNAGVKFQSSRNNDILRWPCNYVVSDVNGDDYDDLVVQWKSDSDYRYSLVYRGSSAGLQTEAIDASTSGAIYEYGEASFAGDFNGDGIEDVLTQGHSYALSLYLSLYIGQESAYFARAVSIKNNFAHNRYNTPFSTFVGDINGDEITDCVIKYINDGYVSFITYLGNSAGTFESGVFTNPTTAVPYYTYTPN